MSQLLDINSEVNMMDNTSLLIEFLENIHDNFLQKYNLLSYDKHDKYVRTGVLLYSSILQLTEGCLVLLDKGISIGIPLLMRSSLEACIDLINLISCKNYYNFLELEQLNNALDIIDESKGGCNEFLDFTSFNVPWTDESVCQLRKMKKKLKDQGVKSLSVKNRFQKAGMEKEYKSIYKIQCCASHNNIMDLMGRHIEYNDNDFFVVYNKHKAIDECHNYVVMNAEILIKATQELHNFLGSPDKDDIALYRAELNKLLELKQK